MKNVNSQVIILFLKYYIRFVKRSKRNSLDFLPTGIYNPWLSQSQPGFPCQKQKYLTFLLYISRAFALPPLHKNLTPHPRIPTKQNPPSNKNTSQNILTTPSRARKRNLQANKTHSHQIRQSSTKTKSHSMTERTL